MELSWPLARTPGPMLRRKCMGPARARSRAQAQGPGPHFLLNIGPGGRASGRLSSKTAKSQTWFISNMVYRLLMCQDQRDDARPMLKVISNEFLLAKLTFCAIWRLQLFLVLSSSSSSIHKDWVRISSTIFVFIFSFHARPSGRSSVFWSDQTHGCFKKG